MVDLPISLLLHLKKLQISFRYYMDILGHPIVPASIITTYYSHFTMLPWDKFVPSLDILHSLLKCVRNNRNNINFVIYLMTQVCGSQRALFYLGIGIYMLIKHSEKIDCSFSLGTARQYSPNCSKINC